MVIMTKRKLAMNCCFKFTEENDDEETIENVQKEKVAEEFWYRKYSVH